MPSESWPAIDVIVPVFNEAATIAGKLTNLARLDYPRAQLRILVVDGQSRDATTAVAEEWRQQGRLALEVLRSGAVGKPAQIAAALTSCTADWVLVTDADARLPPGTLTSLVRLAQSDPAVALVGTPVRPAGAHPVDEAHWAIANWLRRVERRLGTAGLVVGPCYLARRSLLATLGPDTIADDVHLSCRALLEGARIEMAGETVLELRAPAGIAELLRHKIRKALGYVHEVTRALPRARLGPIRPALVFFGRVGLLFGLPCLVGGTAALLVLNPGWTIGAAASLVMLGATALAINRGLLPARRRPVTLGALLASLGLTSIVLTLAVVLYPFVRLSARYPRVSLPAGTLAEWDAT